MSCISSNFSSFFLNSLNDPSEFSKYLSNGELRFSSTFEDFPAYGQNNGQQQQPQSFNGTAIDGEEGNSNIENTQPTVASGQHYGSYHHAQNQQQLQQHHAGHHHHHHQQQPTRWALPHQQANNHPQNLPQNPATATPNSSGTHHFDGSFEFMKYLRHSNDYNENSHEANGQQNPQQPSHATAVGTKPEASLNNGLMDLDSAHKRATARKTPLLSSANSNHHTPTASNSSHPTPMDIYDHDSKHNIYDLHHMNSVHSSNSNESSMELSSMTYPNSHLNASNSNTSSEGGNTQNHSDFSMLSGVSNSQNSSTANAVSSTTAAAAPTTPAAPKPLASFTIKENFEAHPSHKVEEGIFQHMNKLPPKKKDNLKQLGVRFTGQMTLDDKSIIVENFIKFCQEYEITDHRPFLSLNQSGLNKPDQIKFARYLGQGLPTFTLFCIYSNFKNLFCTKRTEIYTKDGYNLPYILDKIKRFLANTTAGNNNNNASNSSSTSTTTTKDSTSNTKSTNSNSIPNTNAVNANNSNNNNNNKAANVVPVVMQNGSSSSNSISYTNGNDNDKGNVATSINSNSSIVSSETYNTPTKQIHNVPSPATPITPQTQQLQQQTQPQQQQQKPTPQIPIQQTQNTPLPAHPPPPNPTHQPNNTPQTMANHPMTPPAHLHPQSHQQQQLHHHVQIPMSPMIIVTTAAPAPAAAATPATLMATHLPTTLPIAAATAAQSTTNHNLQHPHHMQPNNHLPLQHHIHNNHHVHSVAQPSIQHHTTAAVIYQQQQQQQQHHHHPQQQQHHHQHQHHHHQQQQQQHHHQQQLQNHHPLHNLAAQNPPL